MSLAELVIMSVKVEGRTKSEVARDYKISRYWVPQLVRRYESEGEAAFQPRSRRPHSTTAPGNRSQPPPAAGVKAGRRPPAGPWP